MKRIYIFLSQEICAKVNSRTTSKSKFEKTDYSKRYPVKNYLSKQDPLGAQSYRTNKFELSKCHQLAICCVFFK